MSKVIILVLIAAIVSTVAICITRALVGKHAPLALVAALVLAVLIAPMFVCKAIVGFVFVCIIFLAFTK